MSNKIQKFKELKLSEIKEKIIELKKEIIFLKIKEKTKQKIKYHLMKEKKHQIAQLLTLETQYNKKNKNI
uniref:Large ribosomal subunit protein uL29c n=1 Tax=Thuretia quercifolia TaxID=189650 RepID=A0A1Z1MK69_9FLOR|nr:ribosomal protein L29 [Thuretia quercifolia]ARW66467.1 ribosomal protein L29 [Thuretia quercifolia]